MDTLIVAVLIPFVLIACMLWSAMYLDGLPKPFRDRSCQGRFWRRAFPSASKEEIRNFLKLFVKAFGFDDKHSLKFSPEDSVWQIYEALYPADQQLSWLSMDALEFETFSMMLKDKHGFQLNHVLHDNLSLGELFTYTRKAMEA